jgi:uncharacterized protein (TIGR00251 family)
MPLLVEIKVFPASGQQKWAWDKSGKIKCYLKSPAEQGKANSELIKIVAQALKIPQNFVAIQLGGLSRNKVLKISANITYEQFVGLIGLEMQNALF